MTRNFKPITSTQNPLYKDWLKLHKSAGIEKLGKLFVMGEKFVLDYLDRHRTKNASELICTEDMSCDAFQNYKLDTFVLPQALFKELDLLNTHAPLLVIKKPELPVWDSKATPSEI